MRYAVISDIHGNLEALEAVIEALSGEKIDRFISPGDIVGYGRDPVECIKKVRRLGCITVCGNHDAASSGVLGLSNFNAAAREAILWTKKELGHRDIEFLKELKLVYKNEDLTLVHGTLQEPGEFRYMLEGFDARGTFALMETPICFVGHSHIPGIFRRRGHQAEYVPETKLTLRKNEPVIVNAGSVGQPRDNDKRLAYAVYDTEKKSVELKRIAYDIELAQKKILEAGLPSFLAARLGRGV